MLIPAQSSVYCSHSIFGTRASDARHLILFGWCVFENLLTM